MSLQIHEEGNAIVVPLEIKLEKLDKLEDLINELRQLDAEIPQLAEQQKPGLVGQEEFDNQWEKAFEKQIGKFNAPGPITGVQLLQNPVAGLISLFSNPYVASALIAAGVGMALLDWFMIQGNILDKHFKRIIANEYNVGVRRQDRQATKVGIGRQVIITTHSGRQGVEYAFNSYEAVRTGEIAQTDIFNIRYGYRY